MQQPIWNVNRPAVVMDCGTGFSKIGFAGNAEPSFVIPTALGPGAPSSSSFSAGAGTAGLAGRGGGPLLGDLDFTIGEEALAAAQLAVAGASAATGGPGGGGAGGLVFPVRQGMVADWDAMERFWQKCLFHYLRVDPEEHCVVVTEPPLNPPESREAMAEIMFESFNVAGMYVGVQAVLALYLRVDPEEHCVVVTEPPLNPPESREAMAEIMFESFNVAGMYVGVQAVLALYAGWASADRAAKSGAGSSLPGGPASSHLTGTVVDVGEGVTHIIPVVDGFVLGGAIRSLPVAGRAVTGFVQQMLRERGEAVPPDMSLEVCRRIKEGHCYVAPDMLREFGRYDKDPAKYHRTLQLHNPRAGADFTVDLGYERFLAPEVFFSPGICASAPQGTLSLPRAVDDVIQACPIDTRRALYSNVVLSGGSTMFKNFARRLAADMTAATSRRLQPGATAIDITVRSHAMQRFAVWFGGSLLACDPAFTGVCHTREQYAEYGPSICRSNYVFRDS
ncbi:hypothetical protein GPECTOR_2g1135 [Gonium pectorale]|uniref:ARP3 protein n=1 Tax=Gonium pectorale TaxID=33097 RepID=A0A150H0I3_GONPE|nr:hypothetical protein GPECTOR_2g1135 [Gonium pectorale]|eukprot:KXZ55585.1 hypothetical protein GPECTOR_2g1135 [Gonium pectorale]